MRKILTSFSLIAASLAFAQVGINADQNDIAGDAVFHVKNKSSEAKGVILPSVSLTGAQDQATITGKTDGKVTKGLLVWNDGEGALKPAGYYYWDGAKWTLTGNVDGGSSANIYSEDGTLKGNRVVTQDNHNLTFTTGTGGAVVVDGKSKLMGASYVKTTVVGSSSNPVLTYEVKPDDYYISVRSATSSSVTINVPLPQDAVGRVLIISNDAAMDVAIFSGGEQALDGTDSPSIAIDRAMWIISDGKRWFNLINF